MSKATNIDMNISADVKSTVKLATDSPASIQTTNANTFASNMSGTNSIQSAAFQTTEKENILDHEDSHNGVVVVYVTVPIAVVLLAGMVLVFILVIRRRKRQRLRKKMSDKDECNESKKENNNDIGVANEAFTGHIFVGKQLNGNESLSSLYEEIADTGNLYYNYETDHSKNSENLYYDYNRRDTRIEGIVEDEFGYGHFKQKINPLTEIDETYQNVEERTVRQDSKEISKMVSDKIYSGLESDSSPLYMNDSDLPSASKKTIRKESTSSKLSVDDDDPLYDHAKAGGHEWDGKDRDTCLYENEQIVNRKRSLLQTVYMSDTNNNSKDKTSKSEYAGKGDIESNQDSCKIPVYLELEAEEEEDKTNDNKQFQEAKEKFPITNNEYDYASVNGINNGTRIDEIKDICISDDENTGDSDPSRLYFILEKENTIQVEDTEYDSTNNHEYFILEKVEK
ncbi:uncharacterized protein LOC128556375 isoform X2 [Mercenaria mercenaria]|nr:uncharacterized protein LOC128556375 isoform X2 [Mercenaria mercenaria]